MSYIPQKTYSRRDKEVSLINAKEKENVDPFDELLSSPLKQDVQFQPLSFWGNKVSHSESKGKFKKADCGLFEASDSDELNSPFKRKRKAVAKYREPKARTLQPKSLNCKLSNKRKNYSCTALSKHHNFKIQSKKKPLLSAQDFKKDFLLGSTLNEAIDKVPHSSCSNLELANTNRHVKTVKSSFKHELTFCDANNLVSAQNQRKNLNDDHDTSYMKPYNLTFKIYQDDDMLEEQSDGINTRNAIYASEKDSVDSSLCFDKSQGETTVLFQFGQNNFNFVSRRRNFNYPNCMTMCNCSINDSQTSFISEKNKTIVSQFLNDPKDSISKDVEGSTEFSDEIESKALTNFYSSATDTDVFANESLDKTVCPESTVSFASEEFSEIPMLECQGESTIFDTDLFSLNDTELEELILELHNANAIDGVGSSSTSDDTLSSFNDEDTVIKVKLKPEANDSSLTGSSGENSGRKFHLNVVSFLATQISDLSILNKYPDELPEPVAKKAENFHHDVTNEDTEKKNEAEFVFKNVTIKRRDVLNGRVERNSDNRLSCVRHKESQREKEVDTEMEFNHSMLTSGRTSLDLNRSICFANPVFESTRVFDTSAIDSEKQTTRLGKFETVVKDSSSGFEQTYTLKPGKKWMRSMSVLRQIQNGSIVGGGFESTRITGRKFESFVQDMLEIQNEKSGFFTTLGDTTTINKTVRDESFNSLHFLDMTGQKSLLECENSAEQLNANDFNSSKRIFENTVLEKSSFGHTVKVINAEEKPSAFRSALGVHISHQSISDDSIEEKSSAISARDFILMQCGQNDVLPFEDYFNEKTLPGCRKIGEGVYGEVFMYSSAVIKIIPIEGSDKVNGEPQKTFEEIISEVIIAAKLSSLRKGGKHRTEGFSELKRCWCVQGKYPKYLLQLWNEYDQLGNGSENDSPVMFKEDQMYIILELGNGGKDLESFVFSSSAQSLSIFIQAAYSLAAAENAFEFEHRDLHWGNILISETKEKFMNVYVDETQYKIPTKGVKVCIIDFTLSRIHHDGCCIFNDLSVDPGLFVSEGDYQFEIYRLMLKEVKNDWSLFKPKTNLFWLHYTLDKMIKMVRYKNKKAKIHMKHLKDLKSLEAVVLEYKDSAEFVSSETLSDIISKL